MSGVLENRTAVITGGAGDIGRAVAAGFAAAGATVVIVDVAPVDEAIDGTLYDITADVSDADEVGALMAEVAERFSGPHVLVTLAGGSLGTPNALDAITPEHLGLVIDVNIKGTFYCAQAAAPLMAAAGGGSIVTVSSIGGRQPSSLTGAAYATAKASIGGLTRSLAKELGGRNIRVNAIAPGLFLTNQIRERFEAMPEPDRREALTAIALGRLPELREIIDPILFLASDASSFITGITLDVNGGRFLPM